MAIVRDHHKNYVNYNRTVELPNGHHIAFRRGYRKSTMLVWTGTPGNLRLIKVQTKTI